MGMGGPVRLAVPRGVDGWAAVLSSLCLVHCLALPAAAALLPALVTQDGRHSHLSHWLMLAIALPFSIAALLHARRHHRRWLPSLVAAPGFVMMMAGASAYGPLEPALTVGGGLLVAGAHALNWRLLRRVGHRPSDADGLDRQGCSRVSMKGSSHAATSTGL